MPNFQNGKIYSIRSHQTEKVYIGSTTQPLSVRFGEHKKPFNKTTSQEILLFDDAYIELIENYPCADKNELHRREGEIIRTRDCVNKRIAGRTDAEYREEHTEEAKQYNKQYRESNKELIKQYRQEHTEEAKQYNKQYRESNKESIAVQKKQFNKQYYKSHKNIRRCSCGVEFNDGNTHTRNRHYSSQHHIEFVEDFYERLHQLLVSKKN